MIPRFAGTESVKNTHDVTMVAMDTVKNIMRYMGGEIERVHQQGSVTYQNLCCCNGNHDGRVFQPWRLTFEVMMK